MTFTCVQHQSAHIIVLMQIFHHTALLWPVYQLQWPVTTLHKLTHKAMQVTDCQFSCFCLHQTILPFVDDHFRRTSTKGKIVWCQSFSSTPQWETVTAHRYQMTEAAPQWWCGTLKVVTLSYLTCGDFKWLAITCNQCSCSGDAYTSMMMGFAHCHVLEQNNWKLWYQDARNTRIFCKLVDISCLDLSFGHMID